MAEVMIIVDHIKFEYEGIFDPKAFFRFVSSWFNERKIQKTELKNFEYHTPEGKAIEWETIYLKKITDYNRYLYKLRVIASGLKKVEVKVGKKNMHLSKGNFLMYFDGYIEHDYLNKWDYVPLFIFFRTLFDKFMYKSYTERFEQRLTQDMHKLYDEVERFFNVYRHYKPVSEMPHFAH